MSDSAYFYFIFFSSRLYEWPAVKYAEWDNFKYHVRYNLYHVRKTHLFSLKTILNSYETINNIKSAVLPCSLEIFASISHFILFTPYLLTIFDKQCYSRIKTYLYELRALGWQIEDLWMIKIMRYFDSAFFKLTWSVKGI